VILGIDESGTGAWAGPLYLGAVLVWDEQEFSEKCLGLLGDSKQLTDAKRRAVVPLIRENAAETYLFVGTVEHIRRAGMKNVWRQGVSLILDHFRRKFPEVIIDGVRDSIVIVPSGMAVKWEKKADGKYPTVMAASILAKTARNDDMIALSKTHPAYGWEINSGYGVESHRAAIAKFGLTPHHRPIHGVNHPNDPPVVFEDPNVLDLFGKE